MSSEATQRLSAGSSSGGPVAQYQRVGMNHAAFGACELGRQLRQKKLRELKNKRELSKSKATLKATASFNRMRTKYSKQRPLFMEMLKTERLYVDSLHVVVSRFMLPLQVALENFPSPILNKKEISTIFGNIAQLFEVNLELLRIIENNLGIEDTVDTHHAEKKEDDDLASAFAEAFTNMLPVFKAFYSVYANNYENSIDVMEECRAANPLFRKFLEIAAKHEDCKGLDLGDYLIKPVQRICKYPLFFRGLLDCTDESHPMHAKIQAASLAVSRIADQVNQTGQEAEKSMRSFEIANQLEGLEKYDPDLHVVAPGRRFVHEFQCKVHYSFQAPGAKPTKEMRHAPYKKKPRECFLFTDALLIAKPVGEKLEFRFWLELEDILVTIPPSHSGNGGAGQPVQTSQAAPSQQQGGAGEDEDETFSAAQKRLPLDIVRIRIINNNKADKRKAKPNKSVSSKDATQANPSPSNSFSSSSTRSLDGPGDRSSLPAQALSPSKTAHKRSNTMPQQQQMPVVEKYTLWFKNGKERSRAFQRIVALQADLEKRNKERESHLNQKGQPKDLSAGDETCQVPLHRGHERSNTDPGLATDAKPSSAA